MSHRTAVIVDTSHSSHAVLKPVPLGAVRLTDAFWAPRRQLLREVTLPSQHRLLEETGRLDNFRRVSGKVSKPFTGYFFNDSDVYKWLEAAAWALADAPDPALEHLMALTIAEVAAAQQPDGYLNTYYALERAGERWSNLQDMHELYCAGHLFQAAVAHQRATGGDALMAVARRLADYVCAVFGPAEAGKRPGTDGHPEVEMALAELARATGCEDYRRQAQYFLDARGHGLIGGKPYHQDHVPFRELERMVGHAVRAVYLNAGAADLYAETGEEAIRRSLERQWQHMVGRQMYISGGVGARHEGEAFGADYELPNARAYAETCAAIAVVMWAWRMLALDGDAQYADIMELALYNGALAGWGLDGRSYFYVNPLASDGTHRRQPWFNCACCPPNIARLVASLPGYCYSVSPGAIWTHLYSANSAEIALPSGPTVRLTQQTTYPWDGDVRIAVESEGEFALRLRVPGWCGTAASLTVNGEPTSAGLPAGVYAEVRRSWRPGDSVHLRLPMPPRRVASHPYVLENAGRVALMRGPLLYCVEAADVSDVDLRDLVLPDDAALATEFRPDLLGGVVMLRAEGRVSAPGPAWVQQLYRPAGSARSRRRSRAIEIAAIPYYAWANRAAGQMQVWLSAG